jgi:hypothetical protein
MICLANLEEYGFVTLDSLHPIGLVCVVPAQVLGSTTRIVSIDQSFFPSHFHIVLQSEDSSLSILFYLWIDSSNA